MKRIIAGIVFSALAALVVAPPVSWAKTAKECNAEYKEQKDALKSAGTKKKDFITACRAEQETPPAPTKTVAPPPAPEPVAPPPQKATVAPPARTAPPTGAGQFTTDAAAKAKCPADTVVWVNTKSGVYHFAGTHNYGTTKSGFYMCESDTSAAGYRAAKNEKHP
jgi:hypothetical protein